MASVGLQAASVMISGHWPGWGEGCLPVWNLDFVPLVPAAWVRGGRPQQRNNGTYRQFRARGGENAFPPSVAPKPYNSVPPHVPRGALWMARLRNSESIHGQVCVWTLQEERPPESPSALWLTHQQSWLVLQTEAMRTSLLSIRTLGSWDTSFFISWLPVYSASLPLLPVSTWLLLYILSYRISVQLVFWQFSMMIVL